MNDYDGYAPIHRCTCGCNRVIGDGDWASGRRTCDAVRPPRPRVERYGVVSPRR